MHWLQYYIFSLVSYALKEICGPGFIFLVMLITYFANSFDHSLGCHDNRLKQNPYFNCANNTSRTSCHTHSSHQSLSCSSRPWWVEKLYCLLLFNCKIYILPLTPLEVSGFVSRRILPFPVRWCQGKYHTTDSGGGGRGRGVVGSNLLGMCHSHQNPLYSITVYSVASYSPHLSDFWANVIFVIQTQGKEP